MAREEIEMAETREETEAVIQENQGQCDAFVDVWTRYLKIILAMIEQTISEIGSLVEQKRWPEAKQVGIRLKYLDGIRKAAMDKI